MSSNLFHTESLINIIRDSCKPMHPVLAEQETRLKQLPGIKALIFDVYGTVFLSGVGDISLIQEDNRDPAFLNVFERESIDVLDTTAAFSERFYACIHARQSESREQLKIHHPEVDIREVWRDFIQQLDDQGVINQAVDDRQIERLALRYECVVNPVWPAPEVETVLWKMHQEGYLLGVISNAQFFTPLLFERFFDQSLGDYSVEEEACVWSWALKEAKPSVALYERNAAWLLKNKGILPSEVLYIGNDMLNDMLPASKVGYKTALYAGDKRSLRLRENIPECSSLQPDLIISDWESLPELICDRRS